jgi:hypothetical protein
MQFFGKWLIKEVNSIKRFSAKITICNSSVSFGQLIFNNYFVSINPNIGLNPSVEINLNFLSPNNLGVREVDKKLKPNCAG